MALPIQEYALIGDRRTAALVGTNGSIDWLCLPRFDSGACFAALLGTDDHGHWQLRPADHHAVRRRYVGDTSALETTVPPVSVAWKKFCSSTSEACVWWRMKTTSIFS